MFAAQKTSSESESYTHSQSLGHDLRGLRRSKGMTLSELALKIGRSVGFVSQIERGLSSPSIEDMRAIASAFNVPVSLFFRHEISDERERGLIVRGDQRRSLGTSEGGIIEELLSPDLGGDFEMFRTTFEPGAELKEDISRDTEEAGVLISGQLDMWIEGELFHLKAGDSFRLDHKSFRWHNPGKTPTIIIWTVSPPVY